MKPVLVLLVILAFASAAVHGVTVEQQYSVHRWADRVLERPEFAKFYELDAHVNPFCHRADFDGDGKPDFASFARQKSSGKIGIVFLHQGAGRFYMVGAGQNIAEHGDDLSWVDAWIVFDKANVSQGVGEEPPPTLKVDALLIFKTEAASAILWWSGSGYRWYEQGD